MRWLHEGARFKRLRAAAPTPVLISGNLAMIVVMPLVVRSLAKTQRHGRRQLEIQAWHLAHLLPTETQRPASD